MQSLDTPALPPLFGGVPDVTAQNGTGMEPSADIYARLLKNRIVFLGSEVNDQVANFITAQMLYLEAEDRREGHLAVHQLAGRLGHRRHGDLRHDAVRLARRGHHLHGPGRLDGAVPAVRRLHPGKRFALPHARIMMHQPSAGMQGQASDIAIQAEQLKYIKSLLAERIAEHTGQTPEQVNIDSDRDRWFTAAEAKEYGIIDDVIQRRVQITEDLDES